MLGAHSLCSAEVIARADSRPTFEKQTVRFIPNHAFKSTSSVRVTFKSKPPAVASHAEKSKTKHRLFSKNDFVGANNTAPDVLLHVTSGRARPGEDARREECSSNWFRLPSHILLVLTINNYKRTRRHRNRFGCGIRGCNVMWLFADIGNFGVITYWHMQHHSRAVLCVLSACVACSALHHQHTKSF